MNIRRVIITVAATLSVLFIAAVVLREGETGNPLPIAFGGWRSIAGVSNAVLVFPAPPISRPRDNFFWKRTYRIEVDVLAGHEGGANHVNIENSFGTGFPRGPTEVLIPAPRGVRSISVGRAEGILGHIGDNSLGGLRPFPPREKRWIFTFPQVLEPGR